MANMKHAPAASATSEISHTQLGRIGEYIVSMSLLMHSRGRLSPFTPAADDDGIDLLVYDKLTGHALPLQVKARTRTLKARRNTVHFQVRRATFREESRGFLLALYYERDGLQVQRAWLVPMSELIDVARAGKDDLRIRPSIKTTSADRFTPYRCVDMVDVVQQITAHFDQIQAQLRNGGLP
jgi:hypothetical protein